MQFYKYGHVLPPFDSGKNQPAATFRGGSILPPPLTLGRMAQKKNNIATDL